jgi:protein-S-isoprenylcysteine O-methyltransferase Ste14
MEGRDTAGVIAPPPLIFLVGLGLGVALDWVQPLRLMPPGLAWLGMAVVAAAGLLVGWAIRTMRQADTRIEPWRPTTAICVDGPYAYTRNPMYLGMLLFYVGLAVLLNSLWILAVLPFVLAVMTWGVIQREERYLERKFGSVYLDYEAAVRRWV